MVWGTAFLLGLQEELLVEGLVLVAPLVPAPPACVAITCSTITPTGFKGEVEQVVQAYLFRSSILSRAKLGPARLGYLEIERGSGEKLTTKRENSKYFLWTVFDIYITSSRRPPLVAPYCLPAPLSSGLLSKFLFFCELERRGPAKPSLLAAGGSRFRL